METRKRIYVISQMRVVRSKGGGKKKEKGNITFSSANAAEIISSERSKVRIKFEMRELLTGSMWPGFGGPVREGRALLSAAPWAAQRAASGWMAAAVSAR